MTALSLHILDGHLLRPHAPKLIPASIWKRLFNFMVDYCGAVLMLASIFILMTKITGESVGDTLAKSRAAYPIAYRLLGLFALFVYYVVCEFYFKGKTLGKLMTATRVVNRKGEPPCLNCILKRTLLRFIPFEPISLLWFQNQGWHDKWSGTLVVEA